MDDLPSSTTWYFEYLGPELAQIVALRDIVHTSRSEFQRVQIIETGPFGRALVLDGRTQSAEADEWIYHEGLVQPAMVAHAHPQRVFIAGGGEGATAREVLRHQTVTQLVMVDLDREVVALCRELLPKLHQGAFDDPRLTLLHSDALAYLRDTSDLFDVIIVDVADPLEGGPAYLLYTREFYELAASRLTPGGMIVTQAGPAGPLNLGEVFTAIRHTMADVLARTFPYRVDMPSFGTSWGFVVGSPDASTDLLGLSAEEVDRRVRERLTSPLTYYDGVAHNGLFRLPKYMRRALDAEERIITRDNPLYAV